MNKPLIPLLVLFTAASVNLGMSRHGQYDEEARQEEKIQQQIEKESRDPENRHPAKNFASGIKEMTVDSAKDGLGDTAEGTIHEKPIVGTLDGAQKGGAKVIDNTIKGVKKVVSFGYSTDPSYEVSEPEDRSGDAAKIKLFQF